MRIRKDMCIIKVHKLNSVFLPLLVFNFISRLLFSIAVDEGNRKFVTYLRVMGCTAIELFTPPLPPLTAGRTAV